VRRGKFLLSTIQILTLSMLEFSKVLADIVLPRAELQRCEKKTLISGVYVPALHHLLRRYRIPTRRNDLQQNARWLAVCGGYVEAAHLGYPDGFWWRALLNLSKRLGAGPSSGIVPVNASGRVHDCKFVFIRNGNSYGVIACDEVLGNEKWLRGAAESASKLWEAQKLARAVLIGRVGEGNLPDFLPRTKVALVVEKDSNCAASEAVARLND
jgi:hypothetical protein